MELNLLIAISVMRRRKEENTAEIMHCSFFFVCDDSNRFIEIESQYKRE